MEEKKKYLKPVIEDEEILIEDICSISTEEIDNWIGFSNNEEDFS